MGSTGRRLSGRVPRSGRSPRPMDATWRPANVARWPQTSRSPRSRPTATTSTTTTCFRPGKRSTFHTLIYYSNLIHNFRENNQKLDPYTKHVPFDFVVCEQSFPRIKPELSEEDIITSMKSRDDQIRPSDEQCAEMKELHDSVVQGIQKAQQSGGDSDFITESDPAENAQILDFHTIGSYTRNCLLKDSLKVCFNSTICTRSFSTLVIIKISLFNESKMSFYI